MNGSSLPTMIWVLFLLTIATMSPTITTSKSWWLGGFFVVSPSTTHPSPPPMSLYDSLAGFCSLSIHHTPPASPGDSLVRFSRSLYPPTMSPTITTSKSWWLVGGFFAVSPSTTHPSPPPTRFYDSLAGFRGLSIHHTPINTTSESWWLVGEFFVVSISTMQPTTFKKTSSIDLKQHVMAIQCVCEAVDATGPKHVHEAAEG